MADVDHLHTRAYWKIPEPPESCIGILGVYLSIDCGKVHLGSTVISVGYAMLGFKFGEELGNGPSSSVPRILHALADSLVFIL